MSTNKVYGDNPNKLKIIEKSNKMGTKRKRHIFYKGIDEEIFY